MNERIVELAEKAGLEYNFDPMTWLKHEKFAELIVRECADISDACFHNGSAGYTAILKNFGIEE